jgi:hypothetical protein
MTMSDDTDKVTDDSGRRPDGTFAPGNALGGSRQGRANKIGATVKVDLLEAYEQKGGVAWLTALPDALFVALLGKLLPRDLHLEAGGGAIPLTIVMFGQPPSLEAPDDAEARTPA